jgi:hypothetical protein
MYNKPTSNETKTKVKRSPHRTQSPFSKKRGKNVLSLGIKPEEILRLKLPKIFSKRLRKKPEKP